MSWFAYFWRVRDGDSLLVQKHDHWEWLTRDLNEAIRAQGISRRYCACSILYCFAKPFNLHPSEGLMKTLEELRIVY